MLRDHGKLTCNLGFPPSPLSNNPRYWQGADGKLPFVPLPDFSKPYETSAALFSYDYNGDDRLELVVAADVPGLPFERYDYSYDDRGRLASVRFSGLPYSPDPLRGPQTWTYDYDCAP